MTDIKFEIDSTRAEQAFRNGPKTMRAAIGKKLDRAAMELAREARKNAPKAFSTLTNSINWVATSPYSREVFAGADYAEMVELGTGPGGGPSQQSMLDWIRVAGVKPNDPDMDENDLAFVISRAIRSRGTRAQPFMAPARDRMQARVTQLIDQGVEQGIRRLKSVQ